MPNATSYQFEYKLSNEVEWTTGTVFLPSAAFTGTEGQRYDVRVKAVSVFSNYTDSDYTTISVDIPYPTDNVGDSCATAKEITFTDNTFTFTDKLGEGTYRRKDVDIYKLTVGSSDVGRTFTFTTTQPANGTAVDTFIRLFEVSGTGTCQQLAYDDDGGSGRYSTLAWKAPAAGTYYLGISTYQNSSYNPSNAGSASDGLKGDYTLTVTRMAPPTVLAAPTLNDPDVDGQTVAFSWSEVPQSSGYQFEYKLSGSTEWNAWQVSGTSATFIGVLGQTYNVRVKAIATGNYIDSAYSAEKTFTLVYKLSTPSITDTNVKGRTVSVSWSKESNASGYQFEYKQSGDINWTSASVSGTSTSFTGSPGVTYDVRVKATSNSSSYTDSEYSQIASVTIPDSSEYEAIREMYADFELPEDQNDINIIVVDLTAGANLADLKAAIAEANTTVKSDLIIVRTSDTANTLTYEDSTDSLDLTVDATKYGSISVVGIGSKNLTLDANQMCRVMKVNSYSSIANIGGLTLTNGEIESDGGGIYNFGSTLTVMNCTISGNRVSKRLCYGGGIYNTHGTLRIINSTISGNYCISDGGGVKNYGTLTVINSSITGNVGQEGAGIDNLGSESVAMIINSTISENTANWDGGGINNSGNLTIINCSITGNTAHWDGGGIMNSANLTVINSSISENNVKDHCGGIFHFGTNKDSLTMLNCVVSKNEKNGIYISDATARLTNCTIVGNSQAGLAYSGNYTTVNNSIIAANLGGNMSGYGIRGNNNITTSSDPGFTYLPDFSNYEEWLNVRDEEWDLTLTANSTAINKGDNKSLTAAGGSAFSVDLAGNRRISNKTVDIGAYEYQYPSIDSPNISAVIEGKNVYVSWDSVPNAVSFDVQYRAAGTDKWTVKKGVKTNYMTFPAKLGTTYEINVMAISGAPNFDDSAASVTTATCSQVLANLKLKTTYTGDDNATIAVTGLSADATYLQVKLGNSTAQVPTSGDSVDVGSATCTFQNGSLIFTGLESSTKYPLEVQQVIEDPYATNVRSAVTKATITTTKTCYNTPQNVTASTLSDTEVTVSWDSVTGKNSTRSAAYYTVQYSIAGTGKWSNATTKAAGTSFTVTRLKGGTNYEFRVFATKDSSFLASNFSDPASASTMNSAPKIVSVSSPNAEKALLAWNNAAGVQKFDIRYCIKGTNNWQTVTVIATSEAKMSYTFSGLTSGKAYEFQIRSIDAQLNTSAWSVSKVLTKVK